MGPSIRPLMMAWVHTRQNLFADQDAGGPRAPDMMDCMLPAAHAIASLFKAFSLLPPPTWLAEDLDETARGRLTEVKRLFPEPWYIHLHLMAALAAKDLSSSCRMRSMCLAQQQGTNSKAAPCVWSKDPPKRLKSKHKHLHAISIDSFFVALPPGYGLSGLGCPPHDAPFWQDQFFFPSRITDACAATLFRMRAAALGTRGPLATDMDTRDYQHSVQLSGRLARADAVPRDIFRPQTQTWTSLPGSKNLPLSTEELAAGALQRLVHDCGQEDKIAVEARAEDAETPASSGAERKFSFHANMCMKGVPYHEASSVFQEFLLVQARRKSAPTTDNACAQAVALPCAPELTIKATLDVDSAPSRLGAAIVASSS